MTYHNRPTAMTAPSLRERIAGRMHKIVCRPGEIPQADRGCCGCGAPQMDVYVTLGCGNCGAAGEGFCWSCVDNPNWPPELAFADFTVIPGRERALGP